MGPDRHQTYWNAMQAAEPQHQPFSPPTPAPSQGSPLTVHAQVKTFPASTSNTSQAINQNEHADKLTGLGLSPDNQSFDLSNSHVINFRNRRSTEQHYHPQQVYENEHEREHARFAHTVVDIKGQPHLHANGVMTPNGLVMAYDMGPPQSSVALEYSALGRQVVSGGPIQRAMNTMPFSEYLDLTSTHGAVPPAASNEGEFGRSPPYQQSRSPAPPPTHAGSSAYWAQQQGFQASQTSPFQSPQVSSAPFPVNATPHRVMYEHQDAQPRMTLVLGHQYYTPYPSTGTATMARAVSASSASSTYSDSENVSYTSSQGSDYEGVNPAYINASTASLPEGFSSPEISYVHPRPSSAGAAHSFATMRVADDDDDWRGENTIRQRTVVRDGTIRGSPRSSTTKRNASRATARALFAPTPQSMLAPGLTNTQRQKGMTTNAPALPTDEEFKALPTKRSRGRRPPCQEDLETDLSTSPSEAHLGYVGVTKTGKPKKVFICKVPACGKLFKRSEHLKRHVRSIHTDDKPFQCKWPGCMRLFSRHDNLAQHLRVHRAVGQSDASFAAELEACFGYGQPTA